MNTLSDVVKAAKEQQRDALPFAWLYEVEVPTTPPTRYRLCNYTEEIAFGTNTLGQALRYRPAPIAHGGIVQNAEGDLAATQIAVGNASRELMGNLELYGGLIGQNVDIKLVYIGELGNPASLVRHESAQVTGCSLKVDVISFTVSAYNLYKARFPARRYLDRRCPFQYGSAECGYLIALGTLPACTKTYEDCGLHGDDEEATGQVRQHPERFGAFLGTPRLTRTSA